MNISSVAQRKVLLWFLFIFSAPLSLALDEYLNSCPIEALLLSICFDYIAVLLGITYLLIEGVQFCGYIQYFKREKDWIFRTCRIITVLFLIKGYSLIIDVSKESYELLHVPVIITINNQCANTITDFVVLNSSQRPMSFGNMGPIAPGRTVIRSGYPSWYVGNFALKATINDTPVYHSGDETISMPVERANQKELGPLQLNITCKEHAGHPKLFLKISQYISYFC